MSISDSWTTAIFSSTSCLRRQDAVAVDPCLAYLRYLEAQLRYSQDKDATDNHEQDHDHDDPWSNPPAHTAPDWFTFQVQHGAVPVPSNNNDNTTGNSNSNSNAPPQMHTEFSVRPPNTGFHLDCRRILIRILTSQSECLALKASSLRRSKQWKDGVNQYQMSLEKIHQALVVADTQISKYFDVVETGEGIGSTKEDLIQDANIVAVAIQSLAMGRESFLQLGRKEEAAIRRILEPQWQARDEVKRRMGQKRWTSNANPKNDFAKMRKDLEIRYRDVQEALKLLETIGLNLDLAQLNSDGLMSKLELAKDGGAEAEAGEDVQLEKLQQRYNGLRPSDSSLANRVSSEDYPDPTLYGWEFTGSSGVTEFFEKDNVKLDWYFTTATLKTSMDHPKQGKTQMFRKNVDPSLYRKILEDPRTHTNQGYQRTQRNGGRK